MPRLLSSLIRLFLVVSLASLVTSKPTEGDDFNPVPGDALTDLLSFFDGFLPSQMPDSSITFEAIDSSFLDDIDPISPTILSDSSDFWAAAPKPICKGKNRLPFCCRAAGCTPTSTCENGEILCCCTVDPGDTTDNYHDCEMVELPASDLEASRIQIGVKDNSAIDLFSNDDISQNLFDDLSEIPLS